MGITKADLDAQRAMLERGEEKRKAARQAEERERLRDTFAAAALTGLLSNVQRYQNGPLTEQAFEIAEFMLKEREKTSVGVAEMDSVAGRKPVATPRSCARSCSQPFDSAPTTHDAVPEATANAESVAPQPTAGDRSGNPTSHSGTGNTQKPVAWARFFPNGCPMSVFVDRPPADSEPLYLHPLCQDALQKNLTEAEHDALEFAVETGRVAMHDDAILRKLLERLHT